MKHGKWSFPTQVQFGAGSASLLPEKLDSGTKEQRVLLVTDPGLVELPPIVRIREILEEAEVSYSIFSEISPNPTAADVMTGAQHYRKAGCTAIVGVGGGSAMDGAKASALMAHHPGEIEDYDERVGGDQKIGGSPVPPILTIPTTAGTGSEVGRSTVVVHPVTNEKMVIFHPLLMPVWALVDPELMLTLPPGLTATTGLDALTHNIEAFLAKGYHPMADGIALEAIRMCARSLEIAVKEGANLDARADMAAASLMGAVAFQKGLGVTHSLAHPLSTIAGVQHGLANGILLPYTMRFNGERKPEPFLRLAEAVGIRVEGMTAQNAVEAFVDWVTNLNARIGIPSGLSAAGVTRNHIDEMVPQAIADGCHASNPVPVEEKDFRDLYETAL